MYDYNFLQWIAFFAVYCMVGWAFESIYVSIEHRKWVNRGFLNGPFLPIYGFGAIIMLIFALPVRNSIPLIFLFGMTGATLLEYATGYAMEKIFHVKYWDYTYEPLNLNGYICLGCSLMWGALSILLVKVIHEPVEGVVLGLNHMVLMIADIIFLVYFAWDIVISARQAFDLRKIIDEQILQNETVQRMQKRLDVLIAVAEDDKSKRQEKREESREEIRARIENAKAELEQLRAEFENVKQSYAERTKAYRKRAMYILKRNPGTVSKRHKLNREQLRELFRNREL